MRQGQEGWEPLEVIFTLSSTLAKVADLNMDKITVDAVENFIVIPSLRFDATLIKIVITVENAHLTEPRSNKAAYIRAMLVIGKVANILVAD